MEATRPALETKDQTISATTPISVEHKRDRRMKAKDTEDRLLTDIEIIALVKATPTETELLLAHIAAREQDKISFRAGQQSLLAEKKKAVMDAQEYGEILGRQAGIREKVNMKDAEICAIRAKNRQALINAINAIHEIKVVDSKVWLKAEQERLGDLIYKILKEDKITVHMGNRAYVTDILSEAIIRVGYRKIPKLTILDVPDYSESIGCPHCGEEFFIETKIEIAYGKQLSHTKREIGGVK